MLNSTVTFFEILHLNMNMNGHLRNCEIKLQNGNTDVARRNCISTIYVSGTYYEVGYDIGKTFSKFIQNIVDTLKVLNEIYIPLYQTPKGKEIYNSTYEAVNKAYPQYIRELQGMADGAEVPFYKLFLLHLDDILPNEYDRRSTNQGQGCSSVILNHKDQILIGHNEDAFKENLNHAFIANVRITEVEPNEVFTAYCYAGLIPGYAMGFNQYFAFTINIIAAKYLAKGKIPRTFATRAMLAVNSVEGIEQVLRCNFSGVGDALSINLAVFKKNTITELYNIEAAPQYPTANESAYSIIQVSNGQHFFHCNRLLHLKLPEDNGPLMKSSISRHAIKTKLPKPTNKQDVLNILGDHSQKNLNIFRNESDEPVITLAIGIFDFIKRTWSIYMDNPKFCEPVAVLSLYDYPPK